MPGLLINAESIWEDLSLHSEDELVARILQRYSLNKDSSGLLIGLLTTEYNIKGYITN